MAPPPTAYYIILGGLYTNHWHSFERQSFDERQSLYAFEFSNVYKINIIYIKQINYYIIKK